MSIFFWKYFRFFYLLVEFVYGTLVISSVVVVYNRKLLNKTFLVLKNDFSTFFYPLIFFLSKILIMISNDDGHDHQQIGKILRMFSEKLSVLFLYAHN